MGAKRSQRRSVRYDKDQSGCMWGLISMFDFRHGRSARKLIADKKHGSKHISGAGISKNRFEVLRNLEENCHDIIVDGDKDSAMLVAVNNASDKPSVKKLIEEEMVNEQCFKKEVRQSEPAGSKAAKKTRKKSRDMDNHNLGVNDIVQLDHRQSVKDLGVDEIMEEFSRRIQQKSMTYAKDSGGPINDVPELLGDRRLDYEEKLRAAIQEFVVQKLTNNGKHLKDEKIRNSNEIMNELELISSNEELFMKLVQDPKSMLVKYVQNLQDSSVAVSDKLSEQKLVDDVKKSEDLVNHHHKHRSFFRRKVKSKDGNLAKEDENPESLSRIVILKPSSLLLRSSETENILVSPDIATEKEKEVSDRVGSSSSHFFLSEIKRRLKHAMGKQHHEVLRTTEKSTVGKGNVNLGLNSPTKEHFFMERKPSSGKKNKARDSEMNLHLGNNVVPPNERISNIYIEAKKHLSEMLSIGDDGGAEFSTRQNAKSLGRILSLPEYSTSPVASPGRDWEKSFVTARTRFSPKHMSSPVTEEAQNLAPNSDPNPGICDDHVVNDIKVEDTGKDEETSFADDSSHDAKGENSVLDSLNDEPSGDSSARDDQNVDDSVVSDDSVSVCFEQDSNEESALQSSPPGSPSSPLVTGKVLDPEIAADLPEKPSPVSVLQVVFSEDDISPTNTISQLIKLTIQPLQIRFEEVSNSPRPNEKRCLDNKEAVLGYVKAVIQASGFYWDKICIKLLSSDRLLSPTLVDEIDLFSDHLCCDEMLLLDCINEVLVELCQYLFGSSPWVTFTKHNVLPIPDITTATLETFKGVYWHLVQPPLPRTLDQIVRKDMERTRTWLDTRFESETVGFDMGEAILEDLVEDLILSYEEEDSETELEVTVES